MAQTPRQPSESHIQAFTQLLDSAKKSPKAGQKTLHISYVKRDKAKAKDFPKAALQDATLLPEYDQFTGQKIVEGCCYIKGQFMKLQKPKETEDEVSMQFQLAAELARKQSSRRSLRDRPQSGAGPRTTKSPAGPRAGAGEGGGAGGAAAAAAAAGPSLGPLVVADPSAIPRSSSPAQRGLPPGAAAPARFVASDWAAPAPAPAPEPPSRRPSGSRLADAPASAGAARPPGERERASARRAPGARPPSRPSRRRRRRRGRGRRRRGAGAADADGGSSAAPRRAAGRGRGGGGGGREEALGASGRRSPSLAESMGGSFGPLGPGGTATGRHSPARSSSPRQREGAAPGAARHPPHRLPLAPHQAAAVRVRDGAGGGEPRPPLAPAPGPPPPLRQRRPGPTSARGPALAPAPAPPGGTPTGSGAGTPERGSAARLATAGAGRGRGRGPAGRPLATAASR
eukprot:tig00021127_g18678.t1